MRFKYEAKNSEGEIQQGIIDAPTRRAASELCIKNNLKIVSIKEVRVNQITQSLLKIWEGVKAKEFVIFSRQLATMIDANVPLIQALTSISEQTDNKYFALKLREIILDIDGGDSLSDALAKHPQIFSKFYVNMVKAGELSGSLQKNLNDLADNIEKNYELTSKLKSAMYYPAFIFSAMIVVGFAMMAFVMPKLLEILEESNAELPIQTKILIVVSNFMSQYWWAVGIVLIGAIVAFIYYIKTEDGKREFDQIIIKTPIIGKILNNIYVARFTENLSTLIKSGLPITTALMITSDVIGNEVYRGIIREAADEIKKGGDISSVLTQYDLFPSTVVQMTKIGEETGKLNYTLDKVSTFYIKESDTMVKNFSTLIEPVIMVILAVGVGILVSAVLLPIYQVATSIK